MLEASIAGTGFFGAFLVGTFLWEERSESWSVLFSLIFMGNALIGIYCLVRLIHWAWNTPIPFIS